MSKHSITLCFRFWNWLGMQQETTRRTGSSRGTCSWLWGTTRNSGSFLPGWQLLMVGCFQTSTRSFFQRNQRGWRQQRSPSHPPRVPSPPRRPSLASHMLHDYSLSVFRLELSSCLGPLFYVFVSLYCRILLYVITILSWNDVRFNISYECLYLLHWWVNVCRKALWDGLN